MCIRDPPSYRDDAGEWLAGHLKRSRKNSRTADSPDCHDEDTSEPTTRFVCEIANLIDPFLSSDLIENKISIW